MLFNSSFHIPPAKLLFLLAASSLRVFEKLVDEFLHGLCDLLVHLLQLDRARGATAPDELLRARVYEINYQRPLRELVHADVPAAEKAAGADAVVLHVQLLSGRDVVGDREV